MIFGKVVRGWIPARFLGVLLLSSSAFGFACTKARENDSAPEPAIDDSLVQSFDKSTNVASYSVDPNNPNTVILRGQKEHPDASRFRLAIPPGSFKSVVSPQLGYAKSIINPPSSAGMSYSAELVGFSLFVDVDVNLTTGKSISVDFPLVGSLDASKYYAIFYRAKTKSGWIQGVYGSDRVTLNGDHLSFTASHFGAFQAIVDSSPIKSMSDTPSDVGFERAPVAVE